ncbi:MAG: hypothetical protein CTY25_03525 [Methylobacterium sp.]|nr:MAG: hypothetical protein CTY25_03525 [Methylobacterium sp.]
MTLPRTEAAGPIRTALPRWFLAFAGFGILWNIYGVVQFVSVVGKTEAHFRSMGMSAAQASLYAQLPFWMHAAFAIGVFGGLLGSAMLMLRRREALPVLVVSLVAYLVLYAGDIALGIFAAFGAVQVAILTLVVAIAAGLSALALWATRRNLLA